MKAKVNSTKTKVLTCPKCKGASIMVIETIEASSEHLIENGVWKHSYDNNEYGNGIRTECICQDCGHKWRSRRGINLDNYYISEED